MILGIHAPEDFTLFGRPIFYPWAHFMKAIAETCHAH